MRRSRARRRGAWGLVLPGLLCLVLGGGGEAAAGAPVECHGVGRAELWLAAPAPGDTLLLPHRLIERASLRLRRQARPMRVGVDFRWVGPAALLWQAPRDSAGAPLQATYRYLPLPLPAEWGERPAALPETLVVTRAAARPARGLPPGAWLAIGGSKTFSLEFGSQRDAKLEQSLDLTLRGQLAERVDVQAVLTDRSTPLQPEGTTTELQDLDQILITVTSPWGELRLGDIAVREQRLRFLAHQREMEGLRVRAQGEQREAQGTLGRGLGRSVTLEFLGEQGKQGPYRLLSGRGEPESLERMPGEDAVVVAGSERVWLDDVRLRRGAAEDYTIDYATGELWFTARRPVSAVSEVRIDFQVREGAFERDYYALGGALGGEAVSLAFGWLREQDDTGSAVTTGLSTAERESLRAAGDTVTPIGGGVRADSLGSYVLLEADTLEVPFFLYIGDDPYPAQYGTRYAVQFAFVGAGRGDYQRTQLAAGEAAYVYVGYKRGDYLPGRRLSPPESRDLLAAKVALQPASEVSLSAEGAFSRLDRNTLSTDGDGDNDGAAVALGARWQLGRFWGTDADRVELHATGRWVAERFASLEPLDAAFNHRRWNASSDSVLDGRDRRGTLGLRVRPGGGLTLGGEWEGLRARELFRGERWHVDLHRAGRLDLRGEWWETRTREQGVAGRARRHRARLGLPGDLGGALTYEGEMRRRGEGSQASGAGYRQLGLTTQATGVATGLALEVHGSLRRERLCETGRTRDQEERRLIQAQVDYTGGGTFANLLVSRRQERPLAGPGSVRTYDLADWSLQRRVPQGRWGGEWRGQVTTEESRLRSERLLYVGAGAGHYDSLGHAAGEGDYELLFETGDSSAIETRLESVLRISGRPLGGAPRSAGGWAAFEAGLFVRLELASPDPIGVLLAEPGELWSGVRRSREHLRLWRGDLAWEGPTRAPRPRVRLEERRNREETISGFVRTRRQRTGEVEVRQRVGRQWQGRVEAGREREWEQVAQRTAAAEATDERRGDRVALETTWTPGRRLTLRGRAEGRRETIDPGNRRRTLATGMLTASGEPFGAGRVEVTWERRWATGEPAGGLPFDLERSGWRLIGSGTIRPRAGLSASLWVSVDRSVGRETVISGRMEARAYF